MQEIKDLIQLRPIADVDSAYGWEADSDGVLCEESPGYDSLVEGMESAFSTYPPCFNYDYNKLEWLDEKPGFSQLERRVVDQHIRIDGAWREFIAGLGQNDYPDPPVEIWAANGFSALFNRLYLIPSTESAAGDQDAGGIGSWFMENIWCLFDDSACPKTPEVISPTFTEEHLEAVIDAYLAGADMAINHTDRSKEEFAPLERATVDHVLNGAAVTLSRHAEWTPIDSSLPLAPLVTEKEILEDHLYGPIGFYELGLDQADRHTSYQSPVNVISPLYGRMMATYIFEQYREMYESDLICPIEEFVVYEHGGGDGQLAKDVLGYVRERAEWDADIVWQDFADSLRYVSVEIASAGVATQSEIEKEFPNFSVVQGDAISWVPDRRTKGMVISVLLIDSFPPHLLFKEDEGLKVVHSIPTLVFEYEAVRDEAINTLFPTKEARDYLYKNSEMLKGHYLRIEHDTYKHVYLDEFSFDLLQETMKEIREIDSEVFDLFHGFIREHLVFRRVTVDAERVPQVADYLKRHPKVGDLIPKGKKNYYVNTDLDDYIANVSNNYFTSGAFLAVDLGGPASESIASAFLGFANVMPVLTLQKGRIHASIGQLPSHVFGGALVYLAPHSARFKESFAAVGNKDAKVLYHGEMTKLYSAITDGDIADVANGYNGYEEAKSDAASEHDQTREHVELFLRFIDSSPFQAMGLYYAPIGD